MARNDVTRSIEQLATVLKMELEKENKALNAFRLAQDYHQQQRTKLTSLQQYRMDYVRQLQQEGSGGVKAHHYQQRLSFVAKLDKACEQQGHGRHDTSTSVRTSHEHRDYAGPGPDTGAERAPMATEARESEGGEHVG